MVWTSFNYLLLRRGVFKNKKINNNSKKTIACLKVASFFHNPSQKKSEHSACVSSSKAIIKQHDIPGK